MRKEITYEWDENKSLSNQIKHGIAFDQVKNGFMFEEAVLINTVRTQDNECRPKAVAPFGERLFTLVHTIRGLNIRIISFRRANKIEERIWKNG